MGLWVTAKQAAGRLQKLRLSFGPNSYFRYKRDRDYERKRARSDAKDSTRRAETKRHDADQAMERERRYDGRYVAERAEQPEASDGAD
jgi:hypothetical protein